MVNVIKLIVSCDCGERYTSLIDIEGVLYPELHCYIKVCRECND